MTPSLPLRRCVIVVAALVAGCAAVPADLRRGSAREDVAATERAFAATMAARDHAAFTAFLAPDAVFVSGTRTLRGRSEVAAAWRRFYDRPEAPFSWEPETVEVLDSGTLALSTGPVRDPRGKLIARFTSIWRLEAPGIWRIVFDSGADACDCAPPRP
ncbi:MAG TPA: nuclear transport factor 2 family protein [Casimicrobiaceae bacterium]|nr:nuclear transport factor 2 family protein [Casimicrobiaceae bacterium]